MKKYFNIYVLIFILNSIFIYSCKNEVKNNKLNNEKTFDTIRIETVKIENGWAYKILQNNKVIIYQDLIPAVNGYFVFQNEEDAYKTAELVISKMMKSKDFPSVTVKELDSLGVLYKEVLDYQKIEFYKNQVIYPDEKNN